MPAPERSPFEDGLGDTDLLEMLPNLIELHRSEDFQRYQELLKAMTIAGRQAAIEGEDSDIRYWKGYVAGVQNARGIVEDLIKRAEEISKRDQEVSRAEKRSPRATAPGLLNDDFSETR